MTRIAILKIALVSLSAIAVLVTGAGSGEATGSAWIVDWDGEDGAREAAQLDDALDTVQLFAVIFGTDDRPQTNGARGKLVTESAGAAGRHSFLTVVNDVRAPDGKSVLKDPELVTRLLATDESRAAHRDDLVWLLESGNHSGLELDYERVKESDWSAYLDFCRDLSVELATRNLRLRVVLEPKRMYYTSPLPSGPEYTIMAYNLHGPHSGPGPKATPAFIAGLAGRSLPATGPARIAISTGGFLWRGDERAIGITEKRAMELARIHNAEAIRDPDSMYMRFDFEEDGARSEVWYADALTLSALFRAATDHGFSGIDIWRLGGNSDAALSAIRRALRPEQPARTLRVGENGFSSISQAVREARPGDSIVIDPGQYDESFHLTTESLTISCPAGSETETPVVVRGNIRDTTNSRWRGIMFVQKAAAGPLFELDGFSGTFEHCVFRAEENTSIGKAILMYGGSPSFHACVFQGGGKGTALSLLSIYRPETPRSFIDFTYCLFRDFGDSVAEVNEDVDMRFANCLFTRNGRIVRRFARFTGQVEFVNSVFFFNRSQYLTNHSENLRPIRATNCFTTPHLTSRFGAGVRSLDEQPGIEAQNCLAGSPRFQRLGRALPISLGVDDLAHLDQFAAAAEEAERLNLRLTLAVATANASEEDWRRIGEFSKRGHEIASLGSDRVSMRAEPPLSLGYPLPYAESATATVVPGKEIRIEIDGKRLGTVELGEDGLNLAGLVRRLSRLGLVCHLSPHYAGAPAAHLAGVESQDIAFPKPAAPLFLRMEDYTDRQLAASLEALQTRLPVNGKVFVNPYGVAAPMTRLAAAAAGYVALRSAVGTFDEGEKRPGETSAIESGTIPAVSLTALRSLLPGGDLAESVRVAADYARYAQPKVEALALYSRSPTSPDREEWRKIIAVLHDDLEIQILTHAEIAAQSRVKSAHANTAEAAFPTPEPHNFRPRPDSPLQNAGKRLGLSRDFAGEPLDSKARPGIGLFR